MPLDLLVFNPSKKRRKSKKSRGRSARARTRKRKAAKKHAAKPAANQGGRTMASKKRKSQKGRKGRGRRSSTAHSNNPPSGRRRRHGGGGGGRFSVRGLFDLGTIVEGATVGAGVALSGIASEYAITKLWKPAKPLNPHVMSAVQLGIGVAGQAVLKMIGLGRYAKSFMTGAVVGGVLNSYGAVKANMQRTSAQRDPGAQAGMGRLAGFMGPGANAPGFTASGAWSPSRIVA